MPLFARHLVPPYQNEGGAGTFGGPASSQNILPFFPLLLETGASLYTGSRTAENRSCNWRRTSGTAVVCIRKAPSTRYESLPCSTVIRKGTPKGTGITLCSEPTYQQSTVPTSATGQNAPCAYPIWYPPIHQGAKKFFPKVPTTALP